MPPVGFVSYRLSIRWLPDEASEPTDTVVLTGARRGTFLDTRFFKATKKLDWAFAGNRTQTTAPSFDKVEDSGVNTTLPDGTTLEVGEMINPETGKVTAFEEIWKDEEVVDVEAVLFVRNTAGTKWQARVGRWQHAMGRKDGIFWAWQGEKENNGNWTVRYSTDVGVAVKWLPMNEDTDDWVEGSMVQWEGDNWFILERGRACCWGASFAM
ncbi:hypothetical protein BDZ94DRAFT_1311463 [Collybia nuda]|uniref:Protein HRI1 n=1 Tax=Collybia nuda TaxID=64659 RepID=A0A9P6CH11_9AGAR|nr:hypothetical protein BDZ94DRAFT_1311463 [Collybia nuda]